MRTRLLGSSRAFCALLVVLTLPSCLTTTLWWGSSCPGVHRALAQAEPGSTWFAADGTDALVVALPPDVVDQIVQETDFLPREAVGLMLTSPGLRKSLRERDASRAVSVRFQMETDGQLKVAWIEGLQPSPDLQVLGALPPRGEAFDRGIELEFRKRKDAGGMVWLRVVLTPVAVVLDIVTLPLGVLLFLVTLPFHTDR